MGFATAVTWVELETALMALAMAMALEALVAEVVVAWVDVSEIAKGALTASPLITTSFALIVRGATTEPARFIVEYIADEEE